MLRLGGCANIGLHDVAWVRLIVVLAMFLIHHLIIQSLRASLVRMIVLLDLLSHASAPQEPIIRAQGRPIIIVCFRCRCLLACGRAPLEALARDHRSLECLDANFVRLLVWLLATTSEVHESAGARRLGGLRYLPLSTVLRSPTRATTIAIVCIMHIRVAGEIIIVYDLVREGVLLPPSLLHRELLGLMVVGVGALRTL